MRTDLRKEEEQVSIVRRDEAGQGGERKRTL